MTSWFLSICIPSLSRSSPCMQELRFTLGLDTDNIYIINQPVVEQTYCGRLYEMFHSCRNHSSQDVDILSDRTFSCRKVICIPIPLHDNCKIDSSLYYYNPVTASLADNRVAAESDMKHRHNHSTYQDLTLCVFLGIVLGLECLIVEEVSKFRSKGHNRLLANALVIMECCDTPLETLRLKYRWLS